MGDGTRYLWTQLLSQAPIMLVYLAACILAAAYMGRALVPSVLTLIGAGVLLLTAVSVTAAQAFVIERRDGDIVRLMTILAVVGNCMRAVGLGMLVAAIFVGRNAVNEKRFPHGAGM